MPVVNLNGSGKNMQITKKTHQQCIVCYLHACFKLKKEKSAEIRKLLGLEPFRVVIKKGRLR